MSISADSAETISSNQNKNPTYKCKEAGIHINEILTPTICKKNDHVGKKMKDQHKVQHLFPTGPALNTTKQ